MAESERKTYHGNCHCGTFKFTVDLPDLSTVKISQCNCSICSKKGALWVAADGGLNIKCGEDKLTTYKFGTMRLEHKFCSICGTSVLVQKTNGSVLTNVRSFREFDLRTIELEDLTISTYDGASADPVYEALAYAGPPLEMSEGQKMYTGGCHCGAITIATKTKPLPEVEVKECDCSICFRNGYTFFYPNASQVGVHVSPTTPTADAAYAFGRKFLEHHFCAICGTPLYIRVLGPPPEVVARMPEHALAKMRENLALMPVNLRVLDAVEWTELNVTKERDDKKDYATRME